jgi:hypothetical protein
MLPALRIWTCMRKYTSRETDLHTVYALCDIYYTSPPIDERQLRYAELNRILYIDVDTCRVSEVDPHDYLELLGRWAAVLGGELGGEPSRAPGFSA